MAPDEHDRIFDKALARHLRADGSSPDTANAPSREFVRAGECPGPETLAAYHERSLFAEEMNSWKEHIVGCANCRTVLSHLEATDEIPLQAAEEEKVLAQRETIIQTSASGQSQPAAPVVLPRSSRRARLLRGARWQWLAPAGALAASLLVWIALHENRPSATLSLKRVEVATNQAPPPSAPPVSRAAPEPSLSPKVTTKKPPAAGDEFSIDGANARSAMDATKSRAKQDYVAQVSPSQPLADKESRLRKDTGRESSTDVLLGDRQLDRDGKSAVSATSENAEVQLQAQAANSQLQNQSNANAPKVPGPAPLGQADNTKKAMKTARASAAPPPAARPVAGLTGATSMMEVVTVSNPRLISPPGSNLVWRAGRAGSIDFSNDGGTSWSHQTSGVLADLLTGSAPSDQVCWIVGRVGAILLTTDGGAHWKVVPSPLAEDPGGVRAFDSLHATIWNAHATKSFQTADGGLTWTPVPSP